MVTANIGDLSPAQGQLRTRSNFSRAVSPRTISTALFGTPSASATKAATALFALP